MKERKCNICKKVKPIKDFKKPILYFEPPIPQYLKSCSSCRDNNRICREIKKDNEQRKKQEEWERQQIQENEKYEAQKRMLWDNEYAVNHLYRRYGLKRYILSKEPELVKTTTQLLKIKKLLKTKKNGNTKTC